MYSSNVNINVAYIFRVYNDKSASFCHSYGIGVFSVIILLELPIKQYVHGPLFSHWSATVASV